MEGFPKPQPEKKMTTINGFPADQVKTALRETRKLQSSGIPFGLAAFKVATSREFFSTPQPAEVISLFTSAIAKAGSTKSVEASETRDEDKKSRIASETQKVALQRNGDYGPNGEEPAFWSEVPDPEDERRRLKRKR